MILSRFEYCCLNSPSETSRISAWTCWDTRGRSSAQPSSSGLTWHRGRWRSETYQQYTLCRGFMGFTFLCLLRPVSATFYLDGAHFNHKKRERENQLTVPLCLFWYTWHCNQKQWEKTFSASHSRRLTEERYTTGAAAQLKVRLESCWQGGL